METQTFRGRIGSNLELKKTPSGAAVLKFRLACNDRYEVQGEWKDRETVWINVEAWRELAENAQACLLKGSPVVVVGKWRASSYEQDGEKRRFQFLSAETIAPDLAKTKVGEFVRSAVEEVAADQAQVEEPLTANPFDED